MNDKKYLAIIPFVALAAGVAVLVYGYWEQRRTVEDIKLLFTDHVESVASLVKEGAHEAATSTAMMYEMTEDRLATAARLYSALGKEQKPDAGLPEEEDWLVGLTVKKDAPPEGRWDRVPAQARGEFLKRMLDAGDGEVVDDGQISELNLICLRRGNGDDIVIICIDAQELRELRRETGIGPLLKSVIGRDVIYAALQDESAILAVAPSIDLVSAWADDPALEAALGGNGDLNTRLVTTNGRSVFEGLIPFEMADESIVLLRVGIDASTLLKAEENSDKRFAMLAALVVGIFFLSIFVTWMAWRWQSKREEMRRAFLIEEEGKRHWETIGQMAATVAHEVRNPLNTVNMAAQRLGAEFSIAEKERPEFDEIVGTLQSEAKRVGSVVTEFLDLGKPLNLSIESVEAKEIFEEAVSLASMRAKNEGKEIVVENECSGRVDLDDARFRQMMTNLLDNALDAIPQGGKVTARANCKDGSLHIEIVDNGSGIDDSRIAEVMKPFVSFKSTGTGLGLPLVKRLAKAHGGAFELRSAPGRGTTARIVLPAVRGESRSNG